MRSMPPLRTTLRLFAKAILLLVIANFICLWANFDPVSALTSINFWWLVGYGRLRLIYPDESVTDGLLPAEAMVSAHAIAYTKKTPQEFRIAVIGDSSIMGHGLTDDETFTSQLNARHLIIQGKQVISYNLAYPGPNAALQTAFLNLSLHYQPDLILWLITLFTVSDSTAASNIALLDDVNRNAINQVVVDYHMEHWQQIHMIEPPFPANLVAIRHSGMILTWIKALNYPYKTPNPLKSDDRVSMHPVPQRAQMYLGSEGFEQMPNETWDFLGIGQQIADKAGVPLLMINEPIYIGGGQYSDINYDEFYQRAGYDQFRVVIADYVKQHHIWYDDIWNLVPPERFTDTDLHMDAAGYKIVVDHVIQVLTTHFR